MPDALEQFHLLRPWWLLAIPAVLLLLWITANKTRLGNWSKVIDPRWLPFMLEPKSYRRRKQWPWLLASCIAALALSGPSWQQLPQPLHKEQSALVILLDLSPSMAAADLKPNRITTARYKLQDILQQRSRRANRTDCVQRQRPYCHPANRRYRRNPLATGCLESRA